MDDIVNSDNVINNQIKKGNDGDDFMSKLKRSKFLISINDLLNKISNYVWIKGAILTQKNVTTYLRLKVIKMKVILIF